MSQVTTTTSAAAPMIDAAPRPAVATGEPAGARRLLGAVVALACSAVLGLAAYLTPAAGGVGTHEQLGLPSCGWIALADVPCPTCGMTTSFAHAADGRFLQSFLTQPMGFLLALGTAMAWILGVWVALSGSRVAGVLSRRLTPRAGWLLAGLFVGAWLFKILRHKGVL